MEEKDVLQQILLPTTKEWDIIGVKVNERNCEIFVDIGYNRSVVSVDSQDYPIYDYRPSRQWRHLDLWQYKTLKLRK